MAKPLFKLCKRGLHELSYHNSFVDHRGCICCRECHLAGARMRHQRWRARKGGPKKPWQTSRPSPEQTNHYKVCRLAGFSIDKAAYLADISEGWGKSIERLDVWPV